jgi:plastocyanin
VRTRFLVIVLALLVCGAGATATQKSNAKSRKPVTHTVTLDATSFRPATLTIAPGDIVVWDNKDMIPHTATSKTSGVFDSGAIASGKSWKHTFKTAGDFPYFCQFHPTMKGSIVVKK